MIFRKYNNYFYKMEFLIFSLFKNVKILAMVMKYITVIIEIAFVLVYTFEKNIFIFRLTKNLFARSFLLSKI